jgi:hypothetical protein
MKYSLGLLLGVAAAMVAGQSLGDLPSCAVSSLNLQEDTCLERVNGH